MIRPRLLILSHVLPFPGSSGQELRVQYSLNTLRELFDLTFVTFAPEAERKALREKLSPWVDKAVVLPSLYAGWPKKLWHQWRGRSYMARTGLKFSNYVIGQVEFSPARIQSLLETSPCDCALFEYWHAFESVPCFRQRRIPSVLDMHNILWQSHKQRLSEMKGLSEARRNAELEKYRATEERAWAQFDGLVTINSEEDQYVRKVLGPDHTLFFAPMGIDLGLWPYSYGPALRPRIAYYGGFGSRHNEEAALRCYNNILPQVWKLAPDTEFWLVGSNPSPRLQALTKDPRVKVTGFVEEPQKVLSTMAMVLCPWVGTYGFRSRLVEVMALGVPVVATPEAISGMEYQNGRGILLANSDAALSQHCFSLLKNNGFAEEQSRLARKETERCYSMQNTYGKLAQDLHRWVGDRRQVAASLAPA